MRVAQVLQGLLMASTCMMLNNQEGTWQASCDVRCFIIRRALVRPDMLQFFGSRLRSGRGCRLEPVQKFCCDWLFHQATNRSLFSFWVDRPVQPRALLNLLPGISCRKPLEVWKLLILLRSTICPVKALASGRFAVVDAVWTPLLCAFGALVGQS